MLQGKCKGYVSWDIIVGPKFLRDLAVIDDWLRGMLWKI